MARSVHGMRAETDARRPGIRYLNPARMVRAPSLQGRITVPLARLSSFPDATMIKLDYHIFKSMLNGLLSPYVGGAQRPVYLDVDATYPSLAALTASFPEIRAEFEQLRADWAELPRYHEIDPGEAKISNTNDKKWNVFLLEILGHRPELNRACCPATCEALARVPNVIQAFFSILDPGKSIPEHEGPYLGYLRYHLALRVPKQNPPKLVVKGQDYVWKEGEAVLFDDSWPHSVQNQSKELRAVLVVDVMRPLPLLPHSLNRFILDVFARHTYGRKIARKAEAFAAQSRAIAQRRQAA
jgi:aspartate beta-hydroxylase